jgi:hypothetical protein
MNTYCAYLLKVFTCIQSFLQSLDLLKITRLYLIMISTGFATKQ